MWVSENHGWLESLRLEICKFKQVQHLAGHLWGGFWNPDRPKEV